MSTFFNLELTTAEAYTLKNFLQKHMPKHTDPATISDDARAIGFIHDRIPDITPGQQTFSSEQTALTPHQKLFHLCLDIILTAPIPKIKKDTYHLSTAYKILDSENKIILSFIQSHGATSQTKSYYDARLYNSPVPLSEHLMQELFNQTKTRYQEVEDKQAEEEREKTLKGLQDNIQKAIQYLSSLNSNS